VATGQEGLVLPDSPSWVPTDGATTPAYSDADAAASASAAYAGSAGHPSEAS